jgi:2-keto-4-pentenoate hydratase/2-oxohepta-3-ene-1,7-dioic acid hydratase in catechol pathway
MMHIIHYEYDHHFDYGLLEDDVIYTVSGDVFGDFSRGARRAALGEVRLLAPCQPSKVIALGLNYATHAAEMKVDPPAEPLIFLKPPTTVIGPNQPIVYPAMSQQVDYECELAVVIGRTARHVAEASALDYVLGYTCANDVTARDLQKKDGQWTRAKSFDTFCPLGPWIKTDLDPGDLRIETRVNGGVRQSSRTSDLIFGVPKLISFISHVMTLLPGDVILTGTPSGIGPVQPGDVVEVEIEGIGVLRNPVEDGR